MAGTSDKPSPRWNAALSKAPRLRLSQAIARAKLRPVTIRLATVDIETARGLAARKVIG
jgi:hypothetical protein